MRILYTAALPPESASGEGSPGGIRKIGLTIRLLQRLGHEVILLDSSHLPNAAGLFSRIKYGRRRIGEIEIQTITPHLLCNRKLGKALQALLAPKIALRLEKQFKFDLIIIYNSYIFEERIAGTLQRQRGIPFVLQLEDLPLSRRRGILNIKPRIENALFQRTCRSAALILCVSSTVLAFTRAYNNSVVLYPPIIDPRIEQQAEKRFNPFSQKNINVGYFGGLNHEKGADQVLKLAQLLKLPFVFHIAGNGELAGEFRALMKSHPNNLIYHGFVTEERLFSLLCEMDILINPHTDLKELCEGVFPFKLYEYIASGAYVITTQLPKVETGALDGLCYYDGSVEGLLKSVTDAPTKYSQDVQKLVQLAAKRIASFAMVTHRIGAALEQVEKKQIQDS